MVSARRTSLHQRVIRLVVLVAFSSLVACLRPPIVPPEPPPPPTPEPSPRPPVVVPPPPVPLPPLPPPAPAGPLLIRVGLATDLDRLDLPCCEARLVLTSGEQANAGEQASTGEQVWPLTSKTTLRPAELAVKNPVYRLQVASLKDERQAQGIAQYLAEATGEDADAVFDADTDLYKVRFGHFASRATADAERESLAGLGVIQGWVTSEGGELENPGIIVARGGDQTRITGRWMVIEPRKAVPPREFVEEAGITIHGGRYRGRILVYLNDRGLLNLINELEVEQYLRGVVPKEMGPELYNQMEALKAQTVAARTYAVRNLGEFSSEGYDICSTPRCQVYGGMKFEHRVSDRAIQDTDGQVVLFEGQPAETFYGATCGGHTENVEVVFPLKTGAYLKGVPCMEMGTSHIAGGLAAGSSFPAALTEVLLPAAKDGGPKVFSARLEHLARLADLLPPEDELVSLQRREVVRFVSSFFDMVLDPRLFSIEIASDGPPADWNRREIQLADYVHGSGLLADPVDKELAASEIEELLYHLALYLEVLRHQEVHFLALNKLALNKQTLSVRTESERTTWRLPDQVVTLRRQGGALVAATLELSAGDRLEVYWAGPRIFGLVQPLEAKPVSLRRHAPRQRWSHFVTTGQLRKAVQLRYPGFPFEGFEVLSRGVSGRVGKLRLLGSEGRQQLVEGLAVRWTLDIPDTNFQAKRQQSTERNGWHFKGRGWGHGVGMCQAGAFGMAKRRLGYREILEHYYTDIELGRVHQVRVRVRTSEFSSAAPTGRPERSKR